MSDIGPLIMTWDEFAHAPVVANAAAARIVARTQRVRAKFKFSTGQWGTLNDLLNEAVCHVPGRVEYGFNK